jgi:Tol biopolymer transport system component
MIRGDLDPGSPYVDAALHGDGLTSLQFREQEGGETAEHRSPVSAPDYLQLERRGGRYLLSVARDGEALTHTELDGVDLPDEVYVGLFVCAHDAAAVETGEFSNVRITVPAPADFRPYQDYFPGRLEVLEVATGHRRVLYTAPDALQAPNWTPDGRALVFNRNGLLYRFDLDTGSVDTVDTGFATRNNNDHAISFDGRRLAISHHSGDHGGDSIVYTLPLAGGEPALVTPRGPSYLHGWSPDGRWLVYTGGRDGNYDIYKMRSDGKGDEVRLTDDPALDDGAEFAPDGRHIWFNSARSGRMQLWRMGADGSNQTQVTDDGNNNWFPHLAPDGRNVLYLAYGADVAADDHPWYRHVTLNLLPVTGGAGRVVAYLYGGQGSINVPSWSPDGRYVAFVSN